MWLGSNKLGVIPAGTARAIAGVAGAMYPALDDELRWAPRDKHCDLRARYPGWYRGVIEHRIYPGDGYGRAMQLGALDGIALARSPLQREYDIPNFPAPLPDLVAFVERFEQPWHTRLRVYHAPSGLVLTIAGSAAPRTNHPCEQLDEAPFLARLERPRTNLYALLADGFILGEEIHRDVVVAGFRLPSAAKRRVRFSSIPSPQMVSTLCVGRAGEGGGRAARNMLMPSCPRGHQAPNKRWPAGSKRPLLVSCFADDFDGTLGAYPVSLALDAAACYIAGDDDPTPTDRGGRDGTQHAH